MPQENEAYLAGAYKLLQELIPPKSLRVAATLGDALVIFGDTRGWDLQADALERYRDDLTVARFSYTWGVYGEGATPAQKQRLRAALLAICEKSKNSGVLSHARRTLGVMDGGI